MEGTNYYSQIGQIIKRLREKKHMTKTQLAEHICSVSYITRIENGERCPNSVILRQLTNKLGVHPEYLFRVIESPTGWDLNLLLNQLLFYIERDDYKSITKIIDIIEEKNFDVPSIQDLQLIRIYKCISHAMLKHDYEWGIKETENILKLTYTEDRTPNAVEFSLMLHYGFFLLLNNQNEESYDYLLEIKKHTDNISHLSTHAILAKYYVYLVSACLDTYNLKESLPYINFAIKYCKNYNIHTLLRELYYLKGELYYHLNNEKEFEYWLNKALTLHELIKNSDDEYFKTFIENRLKKIKTS